MTGQCVYLQMIYVNKLYKKNDYVWSPGLGWGIVQDTSEVEKDNKVSAYFHIRGKVVKILASGYIIYFRFAMKKYPLLKVEWDKIGG